ncbi:MAG: DUF2029 domain-containing protein [Caulobacteraceae bacterium]|nr:DUF2029 domain-containing protein [Caulobacteraceae bacterium]
MAALFLPHQYPDFGVFWTAARHAFDPQLYDAAHLTAAQGWWPGMTPHPFVYPPTFLLLIWPFGLPPFSLADHLWGGLSCAAFVLAAREVVRPASAAIILLLCVPVLMAAAYGQSIFFAGASLIGGVALAERRPRLAGVLLAAAMCIKPQVTILAPLAMFGSWRVATAALAAAAAFIVGSCVFGPGQWARWLEALPHFTGLVRQMGLGTVNLLAPGLSAPQKLMVASAGVGFAAWSVRKDLPQRIVGIVCGSLCCATYAVRPDLAVLAPSALAWTLSGWTSASWLRRVAGLALILGLVASPVGIALFMLASLLAGLSGIEVLKEARPRPWIERRRQRLTASPQ